MYNNIIISFIHKTLTSLQDCDKKIYDINKCVEQNSRYLEVYREEPAGERL